MPQTPVYGVDFSGSAEPGKVIWVAEGEAGNDGDVHVHTVESADDRGWGRTREHVYEHLIDFIAEKRDAVFGIDFPFAFPKGETSKDTWREFLEWFRDTFQKRKIDDFPAFLDLDGHPKREHDVRYGGQSPFSPQVRYMVFFGLRELLYPLVIEKECATVRPMGPDHDDTPGVIEVYPAATFSRLGLYRTGYKRSGRKERTRRACNFDGLDDLHDVMLASSMRERAIDSDDALDSICAAVATGQAVGGEFEHDPSRVEGHIYV